MSSSSSTLDRNRYSRKTSSRDRQEIRFPGDEYSVIDLFEPGSVIHNREWNYRLRDQAAAVEVEVVFKAKCSFACSGEGTCRTLKIIDDTNMCHGELQLFIKPGKATIHAKPKQPVVEHKEKVVRKVQKLKTQCDSSEDTSVEQVIRTRVSKKEKDAAQRRLEAEAGVLRDRIDDVHGLRASQGNV